MKFENYIPVILTMTKKKFCNFESIHIFIDILSYVFRTLKLQNR